MEDMARSLERLNFKIDRYEKGLMAQEGPGEDTP